LVIDLQIGMIKLVGSREKKIISIGLACKTTCRFTFSYP